MTSCQENGTWRSINVTCVPYKLGLLGRETGARSLDFSMPDSNPKDTSHLVVTLAVVAAILAAGMIILGVLLIRRRVLSNIGSLSPLVVRSQDFNGDHNAKSEKGEDGCGVQTPNSANQTRDKSHNYHTNLLQGITDREYRTQLNYIQANEDNVSSANEPPYEQVCSEHSYETLRKKNGLRVLDEGDASSTQDTNYESVSSDKESIGYETVANPKEPGYETVSNNLDPCYEVVKDSKDIGYEIVNDMKLKEPGYEVIKDKISEFGYEILRKDSKNMHGYETLKPRPPPPRDLEDETITNCQHNFDLEFKQKALDCTDKIDVSECFPSGEKIPAEILALYAKVDKTKKSHKFKTSSAPSSPPLPANHPILNLQTYSKESESLRLKNGDSPLESFGIGEFIHLHKGKEPLRKINSLNTIETTKFLTPPSSLGGETSSPTNSPRGSLRPLPPLPK